MGSSYSKLVNLSGDCKDHSPGCLDCQGRTSPGNPGTFEDIHSKFKYLEPKFLNGAKFTIKKNLSNHFNIIHTISLGSTCSINEVKDKNEGYKFGAEYYGTKKVGNTERYPVCIGDMTSNGNLSASFMHTLGCRFRIKLSTEVDNNRYKNFKSSAEYRSDDFTLTATLLDPIILKQKGTFILQFLQAITSRIALGAELACNKNNKGRRTNLAFAFRYSTGYRTLSTTIGQAGIRLCYHHIHSQNFQLGVEFQSNLNTHNSKGKLLYQLDIPSADMIFQGYMDSNWKVGAIFKKKLHPVSSASLTLSTCLDHYQQNFCVGFGLNIE